MPFSDCFSNTMNVCVDFLCLDFGAVGSRNPKINVSAVGHRRRSSVVRDSGARLYKLPPASADQSRRPDMIEFGDMHALALSRDQLAVATARRKCRDLRRRR